MHKHQHRLEKHRWPMLQSHWLIKSEAEVELPELSSNAALVISDMSLPVLLSITSLLPPKTTVCVLTHISDHNHIPFCIRLQCRVVNYTHSRVLLRTPFSAT